MPGSCRPTTSSVEIRTSSPQPFFSACTTKSSGSYWGKALRSFYRCSGCRCAYRRTCRTSAFRIQLERRCCCSGRSLVVNRLDAGSFACHVECFGNFGIWSPCKLDRSRSLRRQSIWSFLRQGVLVPLPRAGRTACSPRRPRLQLLPPGLGDVPAPLVTSCALLDQRGSIAAAMNSLIDYSLEDASSENQFVYCDELLVPVLAPSCACWR